MATLRLRTDDLSWREIDDEVIAVDVETSTYLAANKAGTLLWRRLGDGGATRQQLAGLLVETYGIEPERAAEDVEAFLGDLAAQGLLAA
jgi:Coenzyme PQQ synthesis protein D (PqqD)